MRSLYTAFVALLCIVASGYSQTLPCSDPSATPVDSFNVSLTLQSSFRGSGSLSSRSTYQVIWEVIGYTGTGGGTHYVINLPSITFIGNASPLDDMAACDFFGLLAQATAEEAVALGHTPCPGTCLSPATVKVTLPACVERIGSGSLTQFVPCTTDCCTREFSVCCPDGPGSPQITLVSSSSTAISCGESCEPTCPCAESLISQRGIGDGQH